MLSRPSAPWEHVASGTRSSLALDRASGFVYAAEFTEFSAGFFVHDGGGWQREELPGKFVVSIALAPDGRTVLAHEDRAPLLWVRDGPATWRRLPGQRRTPTYAVGARDLFGASDGVLLRFATPEGPGVPVPGIDSITTVCSSGARMLAVRSSTAADGVGRMWRSDDGGDVWTELEHASQPASICAITSGGWMWVADAGVFSGDLAVAAPGEAFAARSLPAPRIEALAVDPDDGTHAWIGIWGAGVYRTSDAGSTWESMGLAGSEVSALVVDFERHYAYASTGSGVFTRTF
jgi:hypothetical protein